MSLEINKIHQGDCSILLKEIKDISIDLTITSPPYDELRDYKGFTFDFENIAKELFRVTKEGGVVVWVVGDQTTGGTESGTSFRQALFFKEIGFNLHDTMIYEKNGMSNPDTVRYYNIFEYMFILSKGKPNTINLLKDKRNRWAGSKTFGNHTQRQKDGSLIINRNPPIINEMGIRNNIWRYNTGFNYSTKDVFAFKHPAMFPEELARDHILSWSKEGDIVLDPMCGSGTTLKMAKLHNRKFIGIEISEEYVSLAKKRIEQESLHNHLL